MLCVSVLNVGHGLCVVIEGHSEVFVFDCGEHSPRQPGNLSGKRLRERTEFSERIETIAFSHLHYDHYCGFMEPLSNVASDVQVVFGRFPVIAGNPALTKEFALYLMSYVPLDPRHGPLDLDLVGYIRQSARNLKPVPVSKGQSFNAAGQRWRVLWPPLALDPNKRDLLAIRKAIQAYDRAAIANPWLKERLEKMRESETYRLILDEIEKSIDLVGVDRTVEKPSHFTPSEQESESGEKLLLKAGEQLRKAANQMSMVLRSDDGVLLTGDASRSAMAKAISSKYCRCSVIQTPHHGGRNYVPSSVRKRTLMGEVWVSSTGGQLSSHVWGEYEVLQGIHLRTDRDLDVELLVRGGKVTAIGTGHWPLLYFNRLLPYFKGKWL